MAKYLCTIGPEDVGKAVLSRYVDERRKVAAHVGSAIGQVQKRDIGKRVYNVNGVVQVENDEQRDRRTRT